MKFLASHESSTRGTFDFPIELYYVDKMHPRYEMPFHWHMEFELMLVLSGEFSLLIDGRSYLLHKGDYQYSHLLFSPVQFHRFLYNFIPVIFLADKVSCLILHFHNHFRMVTGILQFFSQVLYI